MKKIDKYSFPIFENFNRLKITINSIFFDRSCIEIVSEQGSVLSSIVVVVYSLECSIAVSNKFLSFECKAPGEINANDRDKR